MVQTTNQSKNNRERPFQAQVSNLGNLLQISLNESLSCSWALGSDSGPVWMTLADALVGMLESLWYCLVLQPSSSVLIWAAAISLHSPSALWDADLRSRVSDETCSFPRAPALWPHCVYPELQVKTVGMQWWNDPCGSERKGQSNAYCKCAESSLSLPRFNSR